MSINIITLLFINIHGVFLPFLTPYVRRQENITCNHDKKKIKAVRDDADSGKQRL